MKKLILVLLIMIPLIIRGQERIFPEALKITEEMKTISTNSNIDITAVIPLIERPVKMRLAPTIQRANITFIIDGVQRENSFISDSISIEEIESIAVLKDPKHLNIYENTEGIVVITTKKKEEYETLVFAPGFESFLTMQPSKSYFTESWLKSKNTLMVTKWNYRHGSPSYYNPHIYEEVIDYDYKIDYGMDVEYTLYMFFRFMEKENNMSLIHDRQISER